jgi:hypothetical protein
VLRKGAILIVTLGLWAGWLSCAPAKAAEVRGDLSLLGQVRDGDQSRETEAPTDLYGNFIGSNHGADLETYFRLERDFGLGHTATDFYAGALHLPSTNPGIDVTLGRQFLTLGPGGAFVADAGKIRVDPIGAPIGFTVFGGQPRYFEPTFSSESLSQDEQIFGGEVHTTHLKDGRLSLGYFEQDRDGNALRQLAIATGSQSFSQLPGLPHVYGSFALDGGRQNIEQATAGFDVFVAQPRLSLNFESTYYKPQDQGEHVTANPNLREDPIFELFSVSDMLQFRSGLRYMLSRSVSAFGDYSYQNYEAQDGDTVNGHIGSAGVLWLPGGDGLEVVRAEYYVFDSNGGNVNGGRIYYENRVYDRILFHTKIDVGSYVKVTNEHDTAVTGLLGVGYLVLPGFVWEVDFEGNRNKRFDYDYRFDFLISYHFDYRSNKPALPQRTAGTSTGWETVGRRPVL